MVEHRNSYPLLTRMENNPLISPRAGYEWESGGTFNPAAVEIDGKVHILYRAVDSKGVSRIGYARSDDGNSTSYRGDVPILSPSSEMEEFGCEDPRITVIDGIIYFTYIAYSRNGQRISLASTRDFVTFEKHGIISPDLDDKDCVLFPEKIHGKLAMFHRIKPDIQIAYFDNFEQLKDKAYWNRQMIHLQDNVVVKPTFQWENSHIGSGTPPIKTPSGWLTIYHGANKEKIYKAGAMLLDLEDPRKIIGRTELPILEPKMDYERVGPVPNVVFPTAAVLRGDALFVYYGGGDNVCCVATVSAVELINSMLGVANQSTN